VCEALLLDCLVSSPPPQMAMPMPAGADHWEDCIMHAKSQ